MQMRLIKSKSKRKLYMNDLDNKILELFKYLIDFGTQYLDKIDYYNNRLLYKIRGKVISLNICTLNTEYEPNSYSNINNILCHTCNNYYFYKTAKNEEIGFRITIEGKSYNVPKLQRVEQALTIDKIESILKNKESEILNSVLEDIASTFEETEISEEL